MIIEVDCSKQATFKDASDNLSHGLWVFPCVGGPF
jgi:hypothetical protein